MLHDVSNCQTAMSVRSHPARGAGIVELVGGLARGLLRSEHHGDEPEAGEFRARARVDFCIIEGVKEARNVPVAGEPRGPRPGRMM